MPRVKFITTGHSHLVGNFSADDFFTGPEAACRHFVEDAHCAVWDKEKPAAAPAVQASGQSTEAPKAAARPRAPRAPAKAPTPAPAEAPAPVEAPAPAPAADSSAQGGAQADSPTDN